MKLSKKSKIAGIGIILLLIVSVISLTFVKGDKPPDPGTPPTGILSEIYERLDKLETDLTNLQGQIDGIHVELAEVTTVYGNRLDHLSDETNLLREDVDILFTRCNNLQGQIDGIHVELAEVTTVYGNRLTSLEGRANALREDVEILFTRCNNLQNQIDDLNTRVPQQGVISIPAAAFVPWTSDQPHLNTGWYISPFAHEGEKYFLAGVQLPHGSTITRVLFLWYDDDPITDVDLRLEITHTDFTTQTLVKLYSSGDSGKGSTSRWLYHPVNNYCSYCLVLHFPHASSPNFMFFYAVIEYEYPA